MFCSQSRRQSDIICPWDGRLPECQIPSGSRKMPPPAGDPWVPQIYHTQATISNIRPDPLPFIRHGSQSAPAWNRIWHLSDTVNWETALLAVRQNGFAEKPRRQIPGMFTPVRDMVRHMTGRSGHCPGWGKALRTLRRQVTPGGGNSGRGTAETPPGRSGGGS